MKTKSPPKIYLQRLAKALLGKNFSDLRQEDQDVIKSIASKESIVENTNDTFVEQQTFGQRLADRIAAFGGSWTFILVFMSTLIGWMIINTVILSGVRAFDPYPFILLNLVLSTVAAIQAPIILMSQNRQATKDRHDSEMQYEVSLKTELEILRLHQKVNQLMDALQVEDPNKVSPADSA